MKYFKLLIAAAACLSTMACDDYLDRKPDDKIDESKVFNQYNKVNQLVNDLYSGAKSANRPMALFYHFSASAITDECEGSIVEQGVTNNFNSGNWSSMGMPSNSDHGEYWWGIYERIRKANVILSGVEQYNTPDNPLQAGDLQKRIGETLFLRAYLHYLVVRMYGEAPYIDRKIEPTEDMNFKKESVHALVEKICADADAAFKLLPGKWGGADFGRADQGACLGLKAMVRWMAATPLWNGGTLPEDTRQFKNEYSTDPTRWEVAKKAAKELMDFQVNGKPRYSLYKKHDNTDFSNDAGEDTGNSKIYCRLWDMYYDMESFQNESVFLVTKDKGDGWQGDVYPPSWGGGSRQVPVQEQVDEYEYIAPDGFGYPVYSQRAKTDGYDDENPYESVTRDPRFYRDVIYHGATFKNKVINTADGADKIGASNASTTGYYLHKFFKESWNRDKGFSISAPPVWRLPEFIYIYCEAVNETTGPNREIYDLLNEIRERSFMAPIPAAAMSNKELMKEYIVRERRVELFYENNRVWGCRLYLEPSSQKELSREASWKASGSDNNARANFWPYPKTQRMINGMRPVEDPNGKIVVDGKHYKMKRFCVEERVFLTPQHYLFPLMNSELQRCPTLVQNPGW